MAATPMTDKTTTREAQISDLDPTLSTLMDACRKSWGAGYQTAVDTLREFAKEMPGLEREISQLSDQLQSVKP